MIQHVTVEFHGKHAILTQPNDVGRRGRTDRAHKACQTGVQKVRPRLRLKVLAQKRSDVRLVTRDVYGCFFTRRWTWAEMDNGATAAGGRVYFVGSGANPIRCDHYTIHIFLSRESGAYTSSSSPLAGMSISSSSSSVDAGAVVSTSTKLNPFSLFRGANSAC